MSPFDPERTLSAKKISFDPSRFLQLLSLDGYSDRTDPWGETATLGSAARRSAQKEDTSHRFSGVSSHERIDAFDRGLREQGYSDGENIIIERRFWKNDPEQLAKFAAECSRRQRPNLEGQDSNWPPLWCELDW
jgi:hypothetical protein